MRTPDEREYVAYVTARLPHLHRAAYLLCGDVDRAQDIVQSTITTLYVHWNRARAADNLDAYVHRMLVNRFVDEKRLRWSWVLLRPQVPERAGPEPPDVEQSDEVRQALVQLPRGQRTALVLRFLCDLSVEETAAVMGCSAGNVKSQTARGLQAMRPLLTQTLLRGPGDA